MPPHQINDHPNRDYREKNRRERIEPNSIRARDFRVCEAEHDYSEHSKQRANQQTELSIADDVFETGCEQEQIHDEQLQEDRICGDAVRVFPAKPSQQPMIFSHGHRDARPDPSH